jgi:hypothetical protein
VTSTAGAIVYNNISTATNVPVLDISFNSFDSRFQMQTGGTFKSAEFFFSITNNTQTAARIQITLYNVTQNKSYYLIPPTSTTFKPIQSWVVVYDPSGQIVQPIQPPPSSIVVNNGDEIYFGLTVIPLPGQTGPVNPFVCNTTDNTTTTMAVKMSVDQFSTQTVVPRTFYGGGGGGRLDDAGIGLNDGTAMPTNEIFVLSHQQTGGFTYNFKGGDGYFGGGSGSLCGGGGGSYVNELITQVNTYENPILSPVSIELIPQKRVPTVQPSYYIYSWITRYNRLRINSGRGALMFNEST